MFARLLKLTWLEIKIFVREPLGLIGTVGIPVVVFVVFGRMFGRRLSAPPPRMRASWAPSCRCWRRSS